MPLASVGSSARDIMRSLDLVAAGISEGRAVPEETVKLMAKPVMPPLPAFLIVWIGNMCFKKLAKEKGVVASLMDRPFEGGD